MEVSQDQIIGVILNILGYLTAGALWMVIYSFFRGRRKTVLTAGEAVPISKQTPIPVKAAPVRMNSKIEFVNFKGAEEPPTRRIATAVPEDASRPDKNRRNRSEIIRLAREMLLDNTPDEKIKQTLPITDGELAMINNGVKHG